MRTTADRNDVLAPLRAALASERDRIARSNAGVLQALTTQPNLADEDHIPLVHEQFVVLNRHSRNLRALGLITEALQRMDRGDYGICQECSAAISLKRLQAIPWALRCVTCEERHEALSGEFEVDGG